MVTTFDTFADALAETGVDDPAHLHDEGLCIVGVALSDTAAKYFITEVDMTDDDYHNIAFEVKHGRPISEAELWYREQAKKLRGVT